MTGKRIGWIGLGSIGTEMVKRLRAAGEPVTVYARGAGLADAVAAGAQTASDYADLAASSDILALCVYSDTQMTDVLLGQGALAALRPGSRIVIHTTGTPATAQNIAAQAPEDAQVLDACFSGGPADVAAGRLTLMVGGEEGALNDVAPLLRHYASNIHHVGPLGHGQMLKLLNNLLFATNLMNAAELMGVAQRQGFAPDVVSQVLSTCSGASYALDLFARPVPPAAMMRAIRPYLEKDVASAMAAARAMELDISAFAPTARYFAGKEEE